MRRSVAVGLILGLALSGAAAATSPVRPEAGGYAGKATNANGKAGVALVVATFVPRPGEKPREGPQLFSWRGVLKCEDGTAREVGPSIFAPLRGSRFSGRSKVGRQTTTLHGRFVTRTRLRGVAQVVTAGDRPATRCRTGPVTFTAHRR